MFSFLRCFPEMANPSFKNVLTLDQPQKIESGRNSESFSKPNQGRGSKNTSQVRDYEPILLFGQRFGKKLTTRPSFRQRGRGTMSQSDINGVDVGDGDIWSIDTSCPKRPYLSDNTCNCKELYQSSHKIYKSFASNRGCSAYFPHPILLSPQSIFLTLLYIVLVWVILFHLAMANPKCSKIVLFLDQNPPEVFDPTIDSSTSQMGPRDREGCLRIPTDQEVNGLNLGNFSHNIHEVEERQQLCLAGKMWYVPGMNLNNDRGLLVWTQEESGILQYPKPTILLVRTFFLDTMVRQIIGCHSLWLGLSFLWCWTPRLFISWLCSYVSKWCDEPDSGKLITWGSTDDLGQSYVTSGKHGETPEPFPLPTEAPIVRAAAGWAHCVSVTDRGEVYTWGWKECVPSGKVFGDSPSGGSLEKDPLERQTSLIPDQASPRSKNAAGSGTAVDCKGTGEETTKRRRVSSAKQAAESSTANEETLSALPCLVTLSPGVRISAVAAGGRHTLALSDVGQVWGWGYGGEGQLGLGSRIRMVSSPHPVPCIESSYRKDRHSGFPQGEGHGFRIPGTYIKGIACGGRHSAVITDAGSILAFGWGLYGQCGQGSTDDVLSPTCVTSLLGIRIEAIAAGLWHTVCISADGDVYAFGGNQFGQLGTGSDQAETIPRVLDAPSIENVNARIISCGARHSAMVTDDGKIFCWGWNKYGQLGLGDVIDRNIPSQVKIDGWVAKNIACGWWHTLLLAESPT